MVDERFGQSDKYIRGGAVSLCGMWCACIYAMVDMSGLSKWIRQQVRHFPLCDTAMASLERFSNGCMAGRCLSDFNTSMVSDTSILSPMSPIKSIASYQMVTPAVATPSRDNQQACNGHFTAPSPAFVTASQIYNAVARPTHANPRVAAEAAGPCDSDKISSKISPTVVLPATQTDMKILSIPNQLIPDKLKSDSTPLLFSASGTDEPVDCKTSRPSSSDRNETTPRVSKESDEQPGREAATVLVKEYSQISHRHTNVRMGRKRDVDRNGGGNRHKRAHGDDSHLLSVFEEADELANTRTQFVYPDTIKKAQKEEVQVVGW